MCDTETFYLNFYEGISPVSRLIRFKTWIRISHASVRTPNGFIYESVPFHGVVRHGDLSEYHRPGTRIHVYRFEVPSEGVLNGLIWLNKQVGKRYDWKGLFGFLFAKNIGDTDAFFCSELVMGFSLNAGRPLLANLSQYQATPRDLYISPLKTYSHDVVTTRLKSPTSGSGIRACPDKVDPIQGRMQSNQGPMQSNFRSHEELTPAEGGEIGRAQ